MKEINTYLIFDGNARDAMTFYQRCLGGDLSMQTYAEAKSETPAGGADRIIHARITQDAATLLMASDAMAGMPYTQGNNFSISVDCENIAETERLFAAFGEGGQVKMPLQDTFWGARFGMLVDRFGVSWMFNCDQKQTA